MCVKKHQQTPLGVEHFRCTMQAKRSVCKVWPLQEAKTKRMFFEETTNLLLILEST